LTAVKDAGTAFVNDPFGSTSRAFEEYRPKTPGEYFTTALTMSAGGNLINALQQDDEIKVNKGWNKKRYYYNFKIITKLVEESSNNNEFTIIYALFAKYLYKFEIDSFKKHCLIEGLDDIGLTLQKSQKIADFEEKNRQITPWLYNN
jgi:hypothetical protein